MDTNDYIGSFRNKGLICFEEITDYSLITDEKLKRKLKRKSPEEILSPPVEEIKKSKKLKKTEKKSNKSVSFKEEVTVLNENEPTAAAAVVVKKVNKTSNKKKKEPKKKLESDLITIKKIKKSNKTNSTSSLSMHIKATNNEVFDEEDFQKSKYINYYIS